MKKKLVLLGLTAATVLGVSAAFIVNHNVNVRKEVGASNEYTIQFNNSADVKSSGGSSFYLSATEFGRESQISFNSTGSTLGIVKNFCQFQVDCRETNSIAKFANLKSISISYTFIGDGKNMFYIYVGDGEIGNFDDLTTAKQKFVLDGTNNKKQSSTFTVSSSYSKNAIVSFQSACFFDSTIDYIKLTYTC